jgi:hypothetical protein
MATKRTIAHTITGTLADTYQVPEHKLAEIQLMYVKNTGGSTGSYTLTYYDDSETASINILDNTTIASKESFQFGGPPGECLILEENDKIQVSGTTAGSIFITVTEHNSNR